MQFVVEAHLTSERVALCAPAGSWTATVFHDEPFQRATKSAVPLTPTAWHIEAPLHTMAFSDAPVPYPGVAKADHELPFHRSMSGPAASSSP